MRKIALSITGASFLVFAPVPAQAQGSCNLVYFAAVTGCQGNTECQNRAAADLLLCLQKEAAVES